MKGIKAGYKQDIRDEVKGNLLDISISRKEAKRKTFKYKSQFLHSHEVEVQLYRGDEKFPKTAMMTGVSMGQANKRYEREFIRRLDADGQGDAKLWRWKIIDYKKYNRDMAEYISAELSRNKEIGNPVV